MFNKKIIYQVYPMSFHDSNNDGIGDLNGVSQKLGYLKSLNIDYLWLSPFYKTPFKDNGYDISDYYKIDKKFGTKKDFIKLVANANKKKIKIMIDLVFNHTSTEHFWFKKWIKGEKEYKDFYISKYSKNKPPNNWKSKFGGSAWQEYKKNYWYLCLFDKTQADLNWENKKVREKLFQVVEHYIKLGVKGFRFDVINLISKTTYEDDETGDGKKFYTNGYKFHDFMQELRKKFPDNNDFLTIAELSSANIANTIKCTNKNQKELDCAFTFHHLKIDYDKKSKFIYKKPNIKLLNDVLKKWYENVYIEGSIVGFWNNHDQPRSVSRFITKDKIEIGAKMLFSFMAFLPGNTCIYQGEEINMENADFESINDFQDVETTNYLKENNFRKIPKGVLQKSRDNSRTPMQWDDSLNAGFSEKQPWIKINNNYKKVNIKKQIKSKSSTLNFYKNIINFVKKDEVINQGGLVFNNYKNETISYIRKFKNKKYECIFSFNKKKVKYKFKGKIIKNNYNDWENNILKPYQFLVLESEIENA